MDQRTRTGRCACRRKSLLIEGREHAGLLVSPDAPSGAGVLLLHGGAGLGDHERERGARLAELGFTVLAPDLFGERFTDRAHGIRVIEGLANDRLALRARLATALAFLGAAPGVDARRLVAVGHCFGGLAALELARSGADVRAVVSLHGQLGARLPADPGAIRAKVLACAGAEDPFCLPEQRAAFEREMTDARADWQLHVYGGARHGFSVPGIDRAKQPGCAHDPKADARSWAAMLELFGERATSDSSGRPRC